MLTQKPSVHRPRLTVHSSWSVFLASFQNGDAGRPISRHICCCRQGGIAQPSARNCHPERPERSEWSRRICGCSSRISLGTTKGCPILAALLLLRLGWDSTNPICRVSYQRSAGRSGIHPRLPQTAALLKQKTTRPSRAKIRALNRERKLRQPTPSSRKNCLPQADM